MKVQQILDKKGVRIITLPSPLPIREVAKVMSDERIGTTLMTDKDGNLEGILSERDIIRAISQGGEGAVNIPASKLMVRTLITCTAETDLEYVLALMSEHKIRHLPVMRDDRLIGLISVRDVLDMQRELFSADAKRQEQAAATMRQAKEKAELASRTKTEFLANMSHELKTPLNAIVGFSEALQSGVFGPIGSPQVMDYIGEIGSSGRHLLEIINDILDLSRIETGDRQPTDKMVDLDQIFVGCLRLVSGRAEELGIALGSSSEQRMPKIMADERMIKQMLNNLLSNAIKFTPENGSVTLGASRHENGDLAVWVSDSGMGIAPDQIEHVTEPFNQADGSLARKAEGTGLGLALVSAMMRMHGGTLQIESALHSGTTATLHFPASRVIDAAATEARDNGRLSA